MIFCLTPGPKTAGLSSHGLNLPQPCIRINASSFEMVYLVFSHRSHERLTGISAWELKQWTLAVNHQTQSLSLQNLSLEYTALNPVSVGRKRTLLGCGACHLLCNVLCPLRSPTPSEALARWLSRATKELKTLPRIRRTNGIREQNSSRSSARLCVKCASSDPAGYKGWLSLSSCHLRVSFVLRILPSILCWRLPSAKACHSLHACSASNPTCILKGPQSQNTLVSHSKHTETKTSHRGKGWEIYREKIMFLLGVSSCPVDPGDVVPKADGILQSLTRLCFQNVQSYQLVT